ncbi:tRNA (adenosine(37)-N6)-threonylcarbamoyltransferase complex dimerization subunit type 1 TsaB [Idiomarina sp. HP20-50]|uniref:tRNA (adenosine(37)-N6)-threonylcarbamoyltransferase complex dimerization subunit type 1 TsaB n=1 Tax=Idiomarina sp. HP20-50 TaxID=3070813 RepID=UPI00294AB765|nr:tRNA (adenosine(37)-N6)-threonylcarbamoyltransferase complex dimerization subunit type 1 TsaB [Idiomarina sp. HP20-50]MDV6317178.1 tRNA (adenosine(37)-N6)-threonylcarbamoyltransferase complex dimerization subunit type 1 TsaB [Idiomarina sp. HP20-50]
MMTNLLAVDTSTENCSVALQWQGTFFSEAIESPREHSQRLLPFVEGVLQQGNVALNQLDGLVVGVGPGSFTGVRIGVSMAQGLAFSSELPVFPVSSLQALAQQTIRKHKAEAVVACIDARMGEIYYALYRSSNGIAEPLTDPAVAQPSVKLFSRHNLEGFHTAGTGWDNYSNVLDPENKLKQNADCRLPLAEDMLTIAAHGDISAVDAESLEPLYVRNEVTWKKLPGR